jgi:hypothetical protein
MSILANLYGEAHGDDLETCKRELTNTWNKLEANKDSIFYSSVVIIKDGKSGAVLQHTESNISRLPGFYSEMSNVIKSQSPTEPGYRSVTIVNPHYLFEARSQPNQSNWVIRGNVTLFSTDATDSSNINSTSIDDIRRKEGRRLVSEPSMIRHLQYSTTEGLLSVMQKSNFVVNRFLNSPDNIGCKRIEYSYGAKELPSSGWLDLDPTKGWSLREVSITETGTGVTSIGNTKYSVDVYPGDLPLLTGYTSSSVIKRDGKVIRDIISEAKITPEPGRSTQESDYSLTAYGFPEPEGVVWKKPIPLYVWLLAGAAAFALIALVCRWLLRRRSKSAPVVPPPAA